VRERINTQGDCLKVADSKTKKKQTNKKTMTTQDLFDEQVRMAVQAGYEQNFYLALHHANAYAKNNTGHLAVAHKVTEPFSFFFFVLKNITL